MVDLFGRRRLFLIGLTFFTLGSLLAGVASSTNMLLLARAIQGLGAAIVIPAEQSLLVATFTNPTELNRAMGIWSAMGAAGAASGVVLGGVLTQFLGWPWIFLINLPIALPVLLLTPLLLPKSREKYHVGTRPSLDLPGAITITASLLLLAYAPIIALEAGWTSPLTIGAFLLALILLLLFVWIEHLTATPLVPLRIFRLRNLNGAALVSLLVGMSHAPLFFFLSLFLQQVLHYDALQAGFAVLPIALINITFSSLLIDRALKRVGARIVLAAGMFLLMLGLLLFARLPMTAQYLWDILPAGVLVALGLPAAFVGTTLPAVKAVQPAETGLASGVINTFQRVGSGLGVAILSPLTAFFAGPLPTLASKTFGLQMAFLGAALFALLGVIVTLSVIRLPRSGSGE